MPSLYDLALAPCQAFGLRRLRRRLLSRLRGRSLEIGAGTGLNLPLYPRGVEAVVTEPRRAFLRTARTRHQPSHHLVQADAQHLPFRDGAFDTVLATLALCTIPHPHLALQEARRVLRPGGTLLLLEHVRSTWPPLARVQDILTPAWRLLAGGCHLNRDTLALTAQAGFTPVRVRRMLLGSLLLVEAHRP